MTDSLQNQFRICLETHKTEQEIQERLTLRKLTPQEHSILEELVNGSLQQNIPTLACELDLSLNLVETTLAKFAPLKLYQVCGHTIIVDKELRRSFEQQLIKFETNFVPNVRYVRSILKRIPLGSLLDWYSISRCSDNIIDSIVERYLSDPSKYEKMIEETELPSEQLRQIRDAVFSSPTLSLPVEELCETLSLTAEEFHQALLELEYRFLCFISYEPTEEGWREIITPFAEWRDYQLKLRSLPPPSLSDESVTPEQESAEWFLQLIEGALSGKEVTDSVQEFNLHTGLTDEQGQPTDVGSQWLEGSLLERAYVIYRSPILVPHGPFPLYSERSLRQAEKSIRTIIGRGWVSFNDFFKSLTIRLGDTPPVTLAPAGRKKWHYALPSYGEEEKLFMEKVLFERLAYASFIEVGMCEGERCLRITPLGEAVLGE